MYIYIYIYVNTEGFLMNGRICHNTLILSCLSYNNNSTTKLDKKTHKIAMSDSPLTDWTMQFFLYEYWFIPDYKYQMKMQ